MRILRWLALFASVRLPSLATDGVFNGTVTGASGNPNDRTVVVFTQTTAARSGCKTQRAGDVGLPPPKPGELLDISIPEEIPGTRAYRFIAAVDRNGIFHIELPPAKYTAIIEHRAGDVAFHGGNWLDYQKCQEIPGVFGSGEESSKHLNFHLRDASPRP